MAVELAREGVDLRGTPLVAEGAGEVVQHAPAPLAGAGRAQAGGACQGEGRFIGQRLREAHGGGDAAGGEAAAGVLRALGEGHGEGCRGQG